MSFARVLCLTLGLSAIAACGGSYEDDCKDACDNTCDGATARTPDEVATCKTGCEAFAVQAKAVDCEDEAKKAQSCNDEHACTDSVNADCADEAADYSRCKTSFCFDNPDNSACSG